MATEIREPVAVQQLIKKPQQYSFFQAIRLLEQASGSLNKVRIHPELSFRFSNSEIQQVKPLEGAKYEVSTNFLGLYGVSSPLPSFYTEELLEAEDKDANPLLLILDSVHQRIYTLYYQVLRKHQLLHSLVEQQNPIVQKILSSLLGTERSSPEHPNWPKHNLLLRYTHLFLNKNRSVVGLKILLEDFFRGTLGVVIFACALQIFQLEQSQQIALGKHRNALGKNTLLGQELEENSGRFIIRLETLNRIMLAQLIRPTAIYKSFMFLIQQYLQRQVQLSLELVVDPKQVQTTHLGTEDWSLLGKNTWIFSEPQAQPYRVYLEQHIIQ